MRNKDLILPNFLIVGAMKSGTTSLWSYLRQHPDIFMPELKEPRFMVSTKITSKNDLNHYPHIDVPNTIDNFEDYLSLFSAADKEKAVGEASPQYLYIYQISIPLIHKYIGDPKIVIILRNPVDRAFSAYKHTLEIDIKSGH